MDQHEQRFLQREKRITQRETRSNGKMAALWTAASVALGGISYAALDEAQDQKTVVQVEKPTQDGGFIIQGEEKHTDASASLTVASAVSGLLAAWAAAGALIRAGRSDRARKGEINYNRLGTPDNLNSAPKSPEALENNHS